jgi:hypothetical protein
MVTERGVPVGRRPRCAGLRRRAARARRRPAAAAAPRGLLATRACPQPERRSSGPARQTARREAGRTGGVARCARLVEKGRLPRSVACPVWAGHGGDQPSATGNPVPCVMSFSRWRRRRQALPGGCAGSPPPATSAAQHSSCVGCLPTAPRADTSTCNTSCLGTRRITCSALAETAKGPSATPQCGLPWPSRHEPHGRFSNGSAGEEAHRLAACSCKPPRPVVANAPPKGSRCPAPPATRTAWLEGVCRCAFVTCRLCRWDCHGLAGESSCLAIAQQQQQYKPWRQARPAAHTLAWPLRVFSFSLKHVPPHVHDSTRAALRTSVLHIANGASPHTNSIEFTRRHIYSI